MVRVYTVLAKLTGCSPNFTGLALSIQDCVEYKYRATFQSAVTPVKPTYNYIIINKYEINTIAVDAALLLYCILTFPLKLRRQTPLASPPLPSPDESIK
ncbi:12367_t:CDS:2 [Rhizophagus irregularis]|nr:12367_t:CDS:2 [Rhizophagus irregularis]